MGEAMSEHTKGRAVPPEHLETFTVPSTGRTVRVRKIPTLLRAEILRQLRRDPAWAEPQPPMVEVDYGDGRIKQPHPGHPVYQELLAAYNTRVSVELTKRMRDLIIRRGLVADADEIDGAAVQQVRDDLAAIGVPLDEYDDRDVYLRFVVIGVEEDWTDLARFILERSRPEEAAIAAHIATFQPPLQGAAAVPSEPGPGGVGKV